MLNLRSNLPFSISTDSRKANLCTHTCLRPQRINTDLLLLLAMHLYPQLKTHISFESAASACSMQSRCTEGNTADKRHIIAPHNQLKDRRNIKGDTTVFTHSFNGTKITLFLSSGIKSKEAMQKKKKKGCQERTNKSKF